MKGEKLNLLLGLLLLPSLLMAQKSPLEPWQDPEVNEVNRMAAHTDFVNKNEWRMSLHGVWGEMPIPGMWEMNGLGEPMYCGIGYEWKTWWKSNPPALPDSANYSYTYVRNWTVPRAWKGRDVILQLRSFNLIHWTRTNLDLTALTCPTGEVDAEGNPLPWSEMGCAWAPEMITTEDGRIMMHFTTRFQRGRNHIRYVYMSDDFSRMTSEPHVLLKAPADDQGRITKNIIYSDITKTGDTYHLFCTEMGHPRHAVSKSLTGPYTFVPFNDGVPQVHEAPMLWKLIGEQKWILMQYRYSMNPHNFYFCETTDLEHFTPLGYFDDGQSPMRRTNFSEQKHGAVVQVTKKELNKLIKYWNK